MNAREKLQDLLDGPDIVTTPGCFDALSARLIERAGFPATFMGGFATSAARIGAPDTGLISYAEMVDQARNIAAAVSIPVLGDGDTGYGNAVNVKRTVQGYAQAGLACVMIEDQVAPKKCGHTEGKQVVSRDEARRRIEAAVDALGEGADILIMARTDANATDGFEEALERCKDFAEVGADITFLEAPRDLDEMRRYCSEVPGAKMANMVEQGKTPFLTPAELQEIGYTVAAYSVSLMLAGIRSMQKVLVDLPGGHDTEEITSFEELKEIVGFPGGHDTEEITSFEELKEIVGFPGYYVEEKRYATD